MANIDRLSPLARTLLDALTESGIAPVNVTSAYRDPDHNARVGGAKNSRHIHGDALDISTAGWTDDQRRKFVEFALSKGARGVGIYPGGAIHLDVRQGAPAFWGPGGSYSSQPTEAFPEWARPVVASMRGGTFQPGPTIEAAKRGSIAPPMMPGQEPPSFLPQAPQAPTLNPLLTALAGAQGAGQGGSGPMNAMVKGIAETARAAAAQAPVEAVQAPTAGDFGLKPTESASAANAPGVAPVAQVQDLGSTLGDIVASVGRVRPTMGNPLAGALDGARRIG